MEKEDAEKKERINESLLMYKTDLLTAEFSAGYDSDSLILVMG